MRRLSRLLSTAVARPAPLLPQTACPNTPAMLREVAPSRHSQLGGQSLQDEALQHRSCLSCVDH